jgi:hypothetical protein
MKHNIMCYSNNTIQWAGHTIRMDDTHIPKAVMEEGLIGKRTTGKPRGR